MVLQGSMTCIYGHAALGSSRHCDVYESAPEERERAKKSCVGLQHGAVGRVLGRTN